MRDGRGCTGIGYIRVGAAESASRSVHRARIWNDRYDRLSEFRMSYLTHAQLSESTETGTWTGIGFPSSILIDFAMVYSIH
jgi:hypothetical protein